MTPQLVGTKFLSKDRKHSTYTLEYVTHNGMLKFSSPGELDWYIHSWSDVDRYMELLPEPPTKTTGVKYDAGKPRLGLPLVEVPRAYQAVGTLLGIGAEKYSVGNWRKVPDGEQRYLDAAMRHLLLHQTGELIDPETGEYHLTAFATNALFMLELHLSK